MTSGNILSPGDLRQAAMDALESVARDPKAPASARVQAAVALLAALGDGPGAPGAGRPASEMDLIELDAELDAIETELTGPGVNSDSFPL